MPHVPKYSVEQKTWNELSAPSEKTKKSSGGNNTVLVYTSSDTVEVIRLLNDLTKRLTYIIAQMALIRRLQGGEADVGGL